MLKRLLFCAIFLTMSAFSLHADDGTTALPIVVNGDKVQYDHANKKVTGSGNVSITYKDVKMTCESIIVDIDSKEGVAEGDVTLYQEGNVFKAEKVIYNFEEKTGELVKGEMNMPPWYGKARNIRKLGEDTFNLTGGAITTCDLEKPHYRIEAKTIKVYLDDRVTAWHAFFYIGDAPVLYIPYYNHPLEDNLPQVDIVPGHNDEWGAYVLSAWRYYFHPDSKGHIHFDWRSKRGIAEGFDYKYGLGKFGDGYTRFYYLHDKEPDSGIPDERWRVQARHKWDIDEDTFMAGEYNRLSDQDMIKEFFYKEEYELENQPSTYLTLTGAKENYAVTVLWRPKVNDFFTVTEKLPEAKMDIRKIRLLRHLNLYYKNESSAAFLNRSFANDVSSSRTGDGYDTTRLDSYNELSYPFQLFGFLSVDPFIGTRQTFYSEDVNDNDNITRHLFTSGVNLYTRFYKIYDIDTDFLNLDIHSIRHLIIPSAKYVYVREPNLRPEELRQFDEIDDLRFTNAVELAIQHKLQTKRAGSDGVKKSVDLLSFMAKGNYIFRDDFDRENKMLDMEYDLELRPYEWMFINADAKLDRERMEFDTVNADLTLDRGKDFTMGAGYRYEKHENSQITTSFSYDLNKDDWKRHWAFNVYERYELQAKKFEEQEYTLIKDLHCWTGELTCRIKDEKDYTFWIIFRLKAFPDIPFFFRTTYHGPEPGIRR